MLPNCMRPFYINLHVTSTLCFDCPQATLMPNVRINVKAYITKFEASCLFQILMPMFIVVYFLLA